MVQTNRRDGCQNRLTNIGTVETTTHAHFQNDHIRLFCCKIIKSQDGQQLELGQTQQGLIRTIFCKQILIEGQISF